MSKLNKNLIFQRMRDQKSSCTSMAITLFGDVVSQHGGWIWMGSLIEALGLFGYSDRLVRTAVSRVVQQDWLQANKVGRKSYYRFTDTAKGHYEKAARRIYAAEIPDWDGSWTFVAPVFVPDEQREEFRKSLTWQGYNPLVNGLFAHPSSEHLSLDETLEELNLVGKAIVFSAHNTDLHSQTALKTLVSEKWDLQALQVQYQDLVKFYRPLTKGLKPRSLAPEKAFKLRVMLIHDYRRVLLRDPDFPEELLPNGWVGFEAYEMVKRLYKQLASSSQEFVETRLSNAQGQLPKAGARFYRRFDGLPK